MNNYYSIMLKRSITLFLALGCATSYAQERLTLQDAISRALKNNYDIQIAEVAERQADVNNTWVGMLPSINGSAGVTQGRSNTRIEFSDPNRAPQVNPRAGTKSHNAGVFLDWRVFDGGRMFLVKKQLSATERLTEAQLKEQIQATVSQVIQAYSQVVLQHQQGIAIDTGLALAHVRMVLSQLKFETGASAKVDYLQARVDYNQRRADSLNQESSVTSAMANLNVTMGADPELNYVVDDSLELNTRLTPTDRELLDDINLTLDVFRRSADISKLNARIANRAYWPTIDFNGGYSYNKSQNQAGLTTANRSYGPSGGFSLNLPIFQGGNIRRQARVASLQAFREELVYRRQNTEIGRQYRTAWRNYETSVAAYRLEQENIGYARENMNIQHARFRVGIATTLETREAENSYVSALVRLYTAAFNVKVSETRVLELEGQLVRDSNNEE
jgi:outer membrane protein